MEEIKFGNGSKIVLTPSSHNVQGRNQFIFQEKVNLCNGTGQIGVAVDISDYCPCPGCVACETDWELVEDEAEW